MACSEPAGVLTVRLLDVYRRQTLQQWQFQSVSVVTIGRSPDREIVIPDARISRLHVVLQNRNSQWWLMAMGQNGVQVDGQMVEECRLTDGSTFRLGQQGPVLEFYGSSAATEGLGNTATEFCLVDSQQITLDQNKLNEDVREIVDGDFFQNLISKASQFRKEARRITFHSGFNPEVDCELFRRVLKWGEKLVARIISTHSFRGGTGKSNTTAILAVMVARAGKRVGVIDTDIQSPGIHVIFAFDQQRSHRSLNDYLWKRCAVEDAAFDITAAAIGECDNTERPRLFLIPSSLNTGEIARILREGYDVALLNDGIRRLIAHLKLDYLFIDTHPGVNEETLLSIAISDVLLLVMRPDSQDFQGTAITAELARRLKVPEIMIVVNKVPDGSNELALRTRIEDAYQAEVVAMLPLSLEVAQSASSGVFSNRFPDHPFSQRLAQVARRLIAADT